MIDVYIVYISARPEIFSNIIVIFRNIIVKTFFTKPVDYGLLCIIFQY